MKGMPNQESIMLLNQDVERYLDEHDKSELSRIVWKMEQLKAADNDPNQLQLVLNENVLTTPKPEVIK
ncbi:hypothetical protein P40081_15090 [Paenibacillus sp. FSL P4-0081]|uniref:hypothetical protein n=1 Tax=Paenibacillus sp. FSL P4-0081 TaxID=1536769 RepID=UPI0004F87CF4|nr:hypothetical protein [Paenibacillus sp. FSL P4-0081]AIQ29330.1 hypothetical protein P40081_15090 [Paenibacillus sp. FSL P4-0081]